MDSKLGLVDSTDLQQFTTSASSNRTELWLTLQDPDLVKATSHLVNSSLKTSYTITLEILKANFSRSIVTFLVYCSFPTHG